MSLFDRFFKNKNKEIIHTLTQSNKDMLSIINQTDERTIKRYAVLLNKKRIIEKNCKKLKETDPQTLLSLEYTVEKLDSLIIEYMNYHKAVIQASKLKSTIDTDEIMSEIIQINEKLKHSTDKLKSALKKRLYILEKRKDKYNKIEENIEMLKTQILTIEDIFKLMYEQSVSLKNPETIVSQVNSLIEEFKIAEETLAEMDEK